MCRAHLLQGTLDGAGVQPALSPLVIAGGGTDLLRLRWGAHLQRMRVIQSQLPHCKGLHAWLAFCAQLQVLMLSEGLEHQPLTSDTVGPCSLHASSGG